MIARMEYPISTSELIAVLRKLAARRPSNNEQLSELEGECAALMNRISENASLSNSVPGPVWHFLSDADIRLKDCKYADAQLAVLAEALSRWEASTS